MVFGLIDFLLGGKKKNKVPKNGQVSTPSNNGGEDNSASQQPQAGQVPDGQTQPTQNASQEQQASSTENQQQSQGKKSSVSEALNKLNSELKDTNEKVTEVVSNVKTLQESVNSLGHRVDNLEEEKKQDKEKLGEMDQQMSKFLSLYELINNQYNPFVSKDEEQKEAKKIVLDSSGNSSGSDSESESSDNEVNSENRDESSKGSSSLSQAIPELKEKSKQSSGNVEDALLELDTLNIEEAAGNAVPLTKIKNDTNSLVIILSWLEYLIKKVGIEETRNSLRYYTEVLRWITPEVYFDLDKYLRGMKDKDDIEEGASLSVRDHIVSLYFISKLNEKTLDEKLTRAVIQMIKQ